MSGFLSNTRILHNLFGSSLSWQVAIKTYVVKNRQLNIELNQSIITIRS